MDPALRWTLWTIQVNCAQLKPLALLSQTARPRKAGTIAYATARIAKLLLLLATTLFCRWFYEVTHDLDTQFCTYHDPVETGAPPKRVERKQP